VSVRALQYAENNLGVHEVWQEAKTLLGQMEQAVSQVDKARSEKRRLEDRILDEEARLLIEERSKHPDQSEAAFKSQYSARKRIDPQLLQLRADLNDVSDKLDTFQSQVEVLKYDLRIKTARLDELGGYLQYLAAIKAEQTTKSTQPTQETNTEEEGQR